LLLVKDYLASLPFHIGIRDSLGNTFSKGLYFLPFERDFIPLWNFPTLFPYFREACKLFKAKFKGHRVMDKPNLPMCQHRILFVQLWFRAFWEERSFYNVAFKNIHWVASINRTLATVICKCRAATHPFWKGLTSL